MGQLVPLSSGLQDKTAQMQSDAEVGTPYKLNSLDPQLESAWFQPLSLCFFKMQLVPLRRGLPLVGQEARQAERVVVVMRKTGTGFRVYTVV
jgi:hypothetical protein